MNGSAGAAAVTTTARRSMLGNFLSLSISTWGAQGIGFLVVVYVARALGAGVLGQLMLAQAVVLYFRLAADMGFDLMGSRRVAADRLAVSAAVADLAACRLANAAIAASLLAVVAFAMSRILPVGWLMLAFGLSVAPAALSLEWAWMGLERMDVVGLGRFTAAAAWLLLVVAFVGAGTSPLVVPLAYVAGQAAATGVLFVLFRRAHGPLRARFHPGRWVAAIRDASPIGLSLLVIQVYVGFGLVALGLYDGERAAGLYAAPQRIVLFLTGAASMFGAALYPRLSALRAQGGDRFEQLVSLGFRLMVFASLPIGVGGMLVAGPLVTFIYGPGYGDSGTVFRWLVPSVVMICVSTVFGYALLAAGGGRRYLRASIAGALVNVAANLVLIPRLHLLGPVVATLGAEGLILVMLAVYTRPFARVDAGRPVMVAAAASALMAGALALLGTASLVVQLPAGAVVYASAIALFKGVTRADLASLRELADVAPQEPRRALE